MVEKDLMKEVSSLHTFIKKAQKGDDKAFLTLFQKYEADIYRIAFVYVKNKSDALDVVQETAYRSFKKITQVKKPEYFKTWLLRIAINHAMDVLRQKSKVTQIASKFEERDTSQMNCQMELKISLQDLMNHLQPLEKSIVLLKIYQDLTFNEISKTLDMPLGTAKTIYYRALDRLREQVKGGSKNG